MLSGRLPLLLACLVLGALPCWAEGTPPDDDVKAEASSPAETPLAEPKKQHQSAWDDWGDLDKANAFGVGIEGRIQEQISQLDGSNLLKNPDGVVTMNNQNQAAQNEQVKDRKKLLAELEAMEAKVREELENDSEF